MRVLDTIDFLNTTVKAVSENAAHTSVTLTLLNQTVTYALAGQQANTQFALKSDGHGGTDLILTPIVGVVPHGADAALHF
jgi:hypothetical protein